MARLTDLPPELHSRIAGYVVYNCCHEDPYRLDWYSDSLALAEVSEHWKGITIDAAEQFKSKIEAQELTDEDFKVEFNGRWFNPPPWRMLVRLENRVYKLVGLLEAIEIRKELQTNEQRGRISQNVTLALQGKWQGK